MTKGRSQPPISARAIPHPYLRDMLAIAAVCPVCGEEVVDRMYGWELKDWEREDTERAQFALGMNGLRVLADFHVVDGRLHCHQRAVAEGRYLGEFGGGYLDIKDAYVTLDGRIFTVSTARSGAPPLCDIEDAKALLELAKEAAAAYKADIADQRAAVAALRKFMKTGER